MKDKSGKMKVESGKMKVEREKGEKKCLKYEGKSGSI